MPGEISYPRGLLRREATRDFLRISEMVEAIIRIKPTENVCFRHFLRPNERKADEIDGPSFKGQIDPKGKSERNSIDRVAA